jgi:beta-lactamase class C
LLFDDKVEFEEKLDMEVIVREKAQFWEQHFVIGTKETKTDQKTFEKVRVSKQARTYSGLYYYVDKKGWVLASETYPIEDAMTIVQEMLLKKYDSDKYSVYVRDLTDGSVAQVNANKIMYAASVTKLAPIYATQLELAEGELSLTDKFKYSKEVNNFKGAYDTAGAGTISKVADNKEYSVEDLLTAIGKRSDNAASNILTYYVTDKNSSAFQETINQVVGTRWDLVSREFSSKTAALMMAAIYEQGGEVIDFLIDTEFADSRIPKAIDAKVAHKTGDAYDFRHDVAIVYADRPFVLSIFTDGADHEDITKIAKDVYSILK